MTSIGALVFCTSCGNLLPSSKGSEKNSLKCDACGSWNGDTGSKITTFHSRSSDFPSALRQKLQSSVQAVERSQIKKGNKAQERCPKCNSDEVTYTTAQLRSADEGSTVIYTCECGHGWHQDN